MIIVYSWKAENLSNVSGLNGLPLRFCLAVIVAICPYSSRGRTYIWKRRAMVSLEGPYVVSLSVLRPMDLCFALFFDLCYVVSE